MANFAIQLQLRLLDHPVIDQAGLTNRYVFTLNRKPDEFQFPRATTAQRAAAVLTGADTLPDPFTPFQAQLGLKLNTTKTPPDMLVIDSLSQPLHN